MSNEPKPQTEPEEEPQKKKGDCLTPSASIVALVIAVIVMITRWCFS